MAEIYAVFPESIRDAAVSEITALKDMGLSIAFREEDGTEDTGRLTSASGLLVILGESGDTTRVKQDLNLALDRHLPVTVLYFGMPELDQGLLIQLGLAERFPAGERDRERAATALKKLLEAGDGQRTEKTKKRRPGLVWGLTILGLIIVGALSWIYLPEYFPAFSGSGEESLSEDTGGSGTAGASVERAADIGGDLKEALISAGVDADGDGSITEAELACIAELTLSNMGLTDISGLSLAAGLLKLDLSGNQISDISELAGLKKLKELNLSGNKVRDVSALLALKELKKADLRGNPVENMDVLAFLEGVEIISED